MSVAVLLSKMTEMCGSMNEVGRFQDSQSYFVTVGVTRPYNFKRPHSWSSFQARDDRKHA